MKEGIYEISSIVVHKDYRRKGIGKQMLQHIIKDIKKTQNYKSIYLTVYPGNIPALILYLKNGFEIYSFKKDVYGPGANRVYLKLTD